MLRSVHQDNYFEISKTVFGQFFILFIIKGVEGAKKFLKQILYQGQNGTRKWVVEVLSSYVVLSWTLYCASVHPLRIISVHLFIFASVTDNIHASVHLCICDG